MFLIVLIVLSRIELRNKAIPKDQDSNSANGNYSCSLSTKSREKRVYHYYSEYIRTPNTSAVPLEPLFE